ncbi:thioredoxin family protein [Sulfurospirillum arcachonense]|uniref:thioredoxin family protein n=1 Tax=Sulfurospirillum arcachonense TaxID=57666 RepID=UPI000468956D|nr:thioredoxin family protein [Sulfurospirillum arcachonense]
MDRSKTGYQKLNNIMQKTIDSSISKNPIKTPCFILFISSSCAPCKIVKKRLESISKQFDDVTIYVIDIHKYPDIVQHYDVRSIPNCLTLDETGKTLRREIGQKPVAIYESMLSALSIKSITASKRLLGF